MDSACSVCWRALKYAKARLWAKLLQFQTFTSHISLLTVSIFLAYASNRHAYSTRTAKVKIAAGSKAFRNGSQACVLLCGVIPPCCKDQTRNSGDSFPYRWILSSLPWESSIRCRVSCWWGSCSPTAVLMQLAVVPSVFPHNVEASVVQRPGQSRLGIAEVVLQQVGTGDGSETGGGLPGGCNGNRGS